jgi:hypothetical protein
MKLRTLFILFIMTMSFFCTKKQGTNPIIVVPEDLLPKNNEISGWQRTGQFWSASTSGDLTTYINGEAVIYINHGFVEAAKQDYEGTILSNIVTIEVRVFDQETNENAKSLYDEIVNQMSNPLEWVPGVGQESKIERFLLSQKIVFLKLQYFMSLSITSGSDEALNILKTFANNIDSKI